MDRKVIVLSPSEWDNRISLGDSMQKAYNHSHYAVTSLANLGALTFALNKQVGRDNVDKEKVLELVSTLDKRIDEIVQEIRMNQRYVGEVATMINYKIKEAMDEDDSCFIDVKENPSGYVGFVDGVK